MVLALAYSKVKPMVIVVIIILKYYGVHSTVHKLWNLAGARNIFVGLHTFLINNFSFSQKAPTMAVCLCA
jgi:hypothetical protein